MKVRLLIFFVALMTSGASLFAQGDMDNPLEPVVRKTPIYLGPVVGYNRSIHTVDLKTFANDPLCPTFQNGSANGFFAGLSFEYLLGNPTFSTSSVILKALYNSLPVSLVEPSVEGALPSRNSQGQIVLSDVQHTNDVTYNVLTVETFYKMNLVGGLGVFAGPTFDFALSKDHNQKLELINPENAQFVPVENSGYKYSTDLRSITVSEGDIPNSNAFRLGLKAGVQYEILMGSFYLVPHVSYNLGVTNLSSSEDWRVNALQIGLDLRYALKIL
jgi:hypothetical protein